MMQDLIDLTLLRWAPAIPQGARAPRGRVRRAMQFLLAHARGRANAQTVVDYVRTMEPAIVLRLRDELLALPDGERNAYLADQTARLKAGLRRAMDDCRRRWGLPVVALPGDAYYVDLPDGLTALDDPEEARARLPRDQWPAFDHMVRVLSEIDRALDEVPDGGRGALVPLSDRLAARVKRRWGVRPARYDLSAEVAALLARREELGEALHTALHASEVPSPRTYTGAGPGPDGATGSPLVRGAAAATAE